ncbi:ATP-binding protein [Vulgatibacter incomptus]|uniref:histidine kinase n=1 Tax=Vulgatibacter incomptus TaxID=1391653 RepID=A0A0K1PHB3_9BACT|nr:ATP-binding protein [Vulgatibacter incomptus]AKU92910.1 two-component hybrid sensor and regulator [Vulgatibacter incomptus]
MEPTDTSAEHTEGRETAERKSRLRASDILSAVRFAAESFLTSASLAERIDEVLERLGEAADVSRVYVFENELTRDGELATSQLFEWVAEGITPQLENPVMQHMDYEEMGLQPWADTLSRGKVYETHLENFTDAEVEFAEPQGIQSFLFVPLLVEGSWWGFIGFDECFTPRRWTDEERDALQAAGSILSAAIQGWRGREEREQLLREQRALTQSAWQRAAEWEAVLASIVDGVWVIDPGEQVTFANEGARRLFELERADDLLRPCSEYDAFAEMLDMSDEPIAVEDLPPCRSLKGEPVTNQAMKIVLRNTGTQKYVRISSAPIHSANGEILGAVAVMTDITESVAFDRMKDQFIRVAAHELKTPVAIMKGYAQLALRGAEGSPPAQLSRLEAIDRGSDRIARIVQDLLGISQLQAGGLRLLPKRFDLVKLVTKTVERVARKQPDRTIDLEAEEAPISIFADHERIGYVVRSLLDNALRYSPSGEPVEVSVAPADGSAQVKVRDFGVGIPADKQDRIFQPFYRAHTDTPYDYGGMGVGLYISSEIVRQHGGRMWFDSREGKGSTFQFRIPLGEGDELGAKGADRR